MISAEHLCNSHARDTWGHANIKDDNIERMPSGLRLVYGDNSLLSLMHEGEIMVGRFVELEISKTGNEPKEFRCHQH